ncbi:hypothetical protein PanWU01x14_091610 [Parasponia andersonii]|uniref:Uncharacterized protein n=1 Tax=Parasponia andersonii TaxID=3476 RepID=A0A2P5D7A5_PARAD|nr:hypothetical protein PanWU01x14_091610 [Parasponia andersonii]
MTVQHRNFLSPDQPSAYPCTMGHFFTPLCVPAPSHMPMRTTLAEFCSQATMMVSMYHGLCRATRPVHRFSTYHRGSCHMPSHQRMFTPW